MPLLPDDDAQASFLNVTMVKRDKTETQNLKILIIRLLKQGIKFLMILNGFFIES